MTQTTHAQENSTMRTNAAPTGQKNGRNAVISNVTGKRKHKKGSTNQDLRNRLAEMTERLENERSKSQYINSRVLQLVELYRKAVEFDGECFAFVERQNKSTACEIKKDVIFDTYYRRYGKKLEGVLQSIAHEIGEEIGEIVIFGNDENSK